jgi:hypothetical protein
MAAVDLLEEIVGADCRPAGEGRSTLLSVVDSLVVDLLEEAGEVAAAAHPGRDRAVAARRAIEAVAVDGLDLSPLTDAMMQWCAFAVKVADVVRPWIAGDLAHRAAPRAASQVPQLPPPVITAQVAKIPHQLTRPFGLESFPPLFLPCLMYLMMCGPPQAPAGARWGAGPRVSARQATGIADRTPWHGA